MTDDDAPRIRLWGDSTRRHRAHPDTGRRPHDPLDLVQIPRGAPLPPPTAAPESEPLRAMAELALRLATDDGTPIAGAQLEIVESGQILTTDADGAAQTTLREGTYEIRFAEPPRLGAPGPGRGEQTILVEAHRTEPFALSTGATKHVVVQRPRCFEVLLDGYAQGSVVLRWGGTRPRLEPGSPIPVVGTARGALAIAIILGHGHHAFVVGHSDPQGSDAANAEVALHRARSTCLYLQGELDAWADHAAAMGDDVDWGCALVAFARITGQEIPALGDPKSLARAHDALLRWGGDASSRGSGVLGSADDWRLVAEAYEIDLARILGGDTVDLQRLRADLTWIETGYGELGERFGRAPADLDPSSQVGLPFTLAQRRSSILIMTAADREALLAGDLERVYDGTFGRVVMETPSEVLVRLRCRDPKGDALPHARVWIAGPCGVTPHASGPTGEIVMQTLRGARFEIVAARDSTDAGAFVSLTPNP